MGDESPPRPSGTALLPYPGPPSVAALLSPRSGSQRERSVGAAPSAYVGRQRISARAMRSRSAAAAGGGRSGILRRVSSRHETDRAFARRVLGPAAAIARDYFGHVAGTIKPDDPTQVVTEADLAIGRYVVDAIRAAYPD